MESCFCTFSLALLLFNYITLTSCTSCSNLTTDQHALLAFKNSITSDPNGILADNWSTNTSICHWIGVSCGLKHQRVIALNVSGFGLGETIAPHIGNLTFLRSLDISANNFRGEIPLWFGVLSKLRYMHMNNNTFSGKIPPSLFNMSSLIEINMRYNRLSGELPNDICSNTSHLKSIDFSVNQLIGEIPANIYKCRELEDLSLPENHLNGNVPSKIGSLAMLRFLSLYSNDFQGEVPAEIGNLSRLEILYLSDAFLRGTIPSSIFNMSSLKVIYLSNNSLFGSIPTNIFQTSPQLEELHLYDNNLTGELPNDICSNNQKLKILALSGNQLYGEIPTKINNCTELEELYVDNNHLNGNIPSQIGSFAKLWILSLNSNDFQGEIPTEIGNLSRLEELYLQDASLRGTIPSSIFNISSLTFLDLSSNSLSGSIPTNTFYGLPQLQMLNFRDNKLTGAKSTTQELEFLSSLTNCQYLGEVDISQNPMNGILPASIGNLSISLQYFWAFESNIKGDIPFEIGNLSGLLYIHWYGNQLTGSIPTTIGKLKRLQKLSLESNRLQGPIPRELCQMTNLGDLYLNDNILTGSIPECLDENKSLRKIDLSSNKLNSTIPSNLWNLRDLVNLSLSSNYLSGQLSSQIGNLKTINQIDLSFNKLSGDIPESIDGCESLGILCLSNNMFIGSIPKSLGNLRGLSTLDLSHNNLSGFIPKSLQNLPFLQYFNVSYNRLEGEIPNGGRFANFTAQSFVHNFALCGSTKLQVPPCTQNHHGRSGLKIVVLLGKYIAPPFVSVIFLVTFILMLIKKRKQQKVPSPNNISLGMFWRRVSYIELVRATSSFSETNLLGRGSFGSVFKGTLSDGLNIAVKVFNLQLEGASNSFDTESEILSDIRHRNLVRVIGCCTNTEFKALILEYMPNGSLEKWLYSDTYCLDLVQRLTIAIEVAFALEYLHHGYTFPVVHCDIKPSNVLLDEDMNARVCDFGISKLFDEGNDMIQTKTLATIGYAAPEYGSEGKVSTKGDVYSYGIMLLEMFTAKKPTDDMFNGEMCLKEWVSKALQGNELSEVVTPDLLSREDIHIPAKEQCISSILRMAMKCLTFSLEERINMIEVVAALNKIRETYISSTTRRGAKKKGTHIKHWSY